jgi:hypothetical protein
MNILARFSCGVLTVSLLMAAVVWAPFADAAPKDPSTTTSGKSDLNKDGVVNYDDLVIFSLEYLEQNVDTVDWCAFYTATGLDDELYGRPPSFYIKHFNQLLGFISGEFCDRSDLNKDGLVDQADLMFFSSKYLELNWEAVNWCDFYAAIAAGLPFNGESTIYYQEHFKILQGFIKDYFQCPTPPIALKIENQPKTLNRMAVATDSSGNNTYYFTDPRVGSVFIYNQNLALIGELKNLNKPLGIAIDSQGYLLVGNDGSNNIEIYDPADGAYLASFGEGLLRMPNAITIGPEGKIYVTDSRNHNIHVFDPAYVSLGTIGSQGAGDAELDFPTDSAIVTRMDGDTPVHELYVTDQGNKRIQIYDLLGNYMAAIYGIPADCGMMGCTYPEAGSFSRLRAIEVDTLGRLHLLDIFEAKVAIMHPDTGALLGSYGEFGMGSGFLRAPIDLLLTNENSALVTDARSAELEVFAIP